MTARRFGPNGTVRAPLLKKIPAELREVAQWVCSAADGKPINPHTGRNAKCNDARTWGTFDEALAACATYGHDYVALALTEADPYCIVDLDDKPDKPADYATLELFGQMMIDLDSYAERSRGGRGIHIVVKATLSAPVKTANVEIYDRGHFFTFTGLDLSCKSIREQDERITKIADTLRPAKPPRELVATESEEPDDVVLQRAADSPAMGAKFAALNTGDRSGYPSPSEADLAYVGVLWNACGNAQQVKRLWLASQLAERAKGQRPDYIARMLAKVMQSPPKLYRDDDPASLFSDTANAHRIVHHMGDSLLFVPGIGWHVWDGMRWKHDPLEARRHVGKLGRIILAESAAILKRAARMSDRNSAMHEQDIAEMLLRFAGQSENVAKIDAAMKVAEPLLRCDAIRMDADPWMLGCMNGVVNLRTAELLPPSSDQLITKSTDGAYDAAATCPIFCAFLERIFRRHPELCAFMQRLAGFWLTGLTDPPYLAVLYGVGANGKSTLVNALFDAMGDYASSAPPGLLMARYGERHPTELAYLQGMRLVVSAESGEGGRLDEERIKALTGSDLITARRMREDFYTFRPTHSFALMTNHKPVVRGTDEGIWRRLLLIPFDEVIPEDERDTTLPAKLRAEAPGILRWAVDGARLFASDTTLRPPQVVADATHAYRTESDVLGAFLSDECSEGTESGILSSQLYACYERWCDDSGERALSKRALGLRLQDKGFESRKDRRGQRMWMGLALKQKPKRHKW